MRLRVVVKTECLHGVSLRGGPSSETGSRSRREREHVRGSRNVRSGRGRSEAAGMRAKGGRYCNDGIRAGLGMGQFRPRDICPSVATHHRHVERNTSFLSIVSDCHASFYIDPLHLPFFCFTLTAPKTPGRRKSDDARLDGRCHQCAPCPPACQPCHAHHA